MCAQDRERSGMRSAAARAGRPAKQGERHCREQAGEVA